MSDTPVDAPPADPRAAALDALRAVGFFLERERAETYRVQAYRKAAGIIGALDPDEVARRAERGTLTDLKGVRVS